MQWKINSDAWMVSRLEPPCGPVDMVLDTDTYNEVDDQFALAYALLSPEKLRVQAVYAAPFHNGHSTGPADGTQKSYKEILRLLKIMDVPADGFVFKGSESFLPEGDMPVDSPAARVLMDSGVPLTVIPCLGVASHPRRTCILF